VVYMLVENEYQGLLRVPSVLMSPSYFGATQNWRVVRITWKPLKKDYWNYQSEILCQ
jgi:hypothetical protein